MDMFEKASRMQLRFETCRGNLTVEDLWNLPLQRVGHLCLNDIAVELYNQLKHLEKISFVLPKNEDADVEFQLQFDIVKHIIDTLMAERDERKLQQERATKKQQLLGLIAQKENEALSNKSLEDLRAMIDNL